MEVFCGIGVSVGATREENIWDLRASERSVAAVDKVFEWFDEPVDDWEGCELDVGGACEVVLDFLSDDTASDIVPMIFKNSFRNDVFSFSFSFSFSPLSLGEPAVLVGSGAAEVGTGPRLTREGLGVVSVVCGLVPMGIPAEWLSPVLPR